MADVRDAFYSRSQAVAGITTLVGTRVSPLVLPQNATLPAVTYQVISNVREHAMGSDAGLVTSRIQATSWADSTDGADGYADATALADAMRAGFSRFSGTVATVVIDEIFLDNELEIFDDGTERVGILQDYIVHYRE